MFNALCKKSSWCSTDSGLLVLRIGVGLIFIVNGWMKVSDLGANAAMFATMGFAPFWAYLVAFVELIGGIAVLLGIYTRIAAGLLTIIMIVAVYVLRDNMQMAMTPISLLFSTLALKLAGGGKYSLMKGHGGCCGKGGCGCEGPCNCAGGTCEAK
ncbi:MAG: DoxX family protein [bacterium]|nr:DoxX family protein [bacterium]